MFTEHKLVPQWRADAKKLNTSLKPDFSSDKKIYLAYDLTEVRALQEDEDKKYTRLKTATGKPFMKRNEARSDIGLDPVDGWDDEDTAKPEPEPFGQPQPQNGNGRVPQNGRQPEPAKEIDLDKWRRKAIKALKAGKSADVTFDSENIPAGLAGAIEGALVSAKTADDISAIFADVWRGYP